MNSLDTEAKPILEINLVPMVGVFAALAIVLMATLPGDRHEIQLWIISGSPPPPPPHPPPSFDIKVNSDGTLVWDGVPIALADLDTRMADARKRNGNITIIPEKLTRYRDVARVMASAARHHVPMDAQNPWLRR